MHNPEYAPFGMYVPKFNKYGIYFKDWWSNRLLPVSRQNFDIITSTITDISISDLAIKNFGLSLSDQYWFCPETMTDIHWKDINFFQNGFEFDYDLNKPISSNKIYMSPNTSTNGDLPKKWIIEDSGRYLCKGSTEGFEQEPINEYIASEILDILEIKHVSYFYRNSYSMCLCFIDENTEFVPAWNIYKSQQKKNNENDYSYFNRVLDTLAMPYRERVDSMLLFDYLIANQDRHFNNFGFIRDVTSLKFIDFAPLFDNGNSLWYTKRDSQIGTNVHCKPFATEFDTQLTFVEDKTIVNFSHDFSGVMEKIFTQYNFPKERGRRICKAVQERQERLLRMANTLAP